MSVEGSEVTHQRLLPGNHAHNIRDDIERRGEQRKLHFRGYFRVNAHNIQDASKSGGEQRR